MHTHVNLKINNAIIIFWVNLRFICIIQNILLKEKEKLQFVHEELERVKSTAV